MKKKLIDRDYPEEIIKKQISRAQQKNRKSLIFKKKQTPQTDKKVRLIFTYNQSNPPIQKWIRQSRKYLDKNEKAKDLGRNIQIAYKQPKNIKKMVGGPLGGLGRAPEKDQGCSKCSKKMSCL